MKKIISILLFALAFSSLVGEAQTLTASWYSMESVLKEGSKGIMANGKMLDDTAYTVASWDYPFGTILEVTNTQNKKMVRVQVTDRGPVRRLYREGRVLDLSVAAFKAIGDLQRGVVPISVKVIRMGG